MKSPGRETRRTARNPSARRSHTPAVSIRRVAAIVLANIGVFVLLWLGLEAGARRFFPRDVHAIFDDRRLRTRPFAIPDAVRGFALRPGYAQDDTHVNSEGFRGPEFPPDLSARKVVLTIGESTTFGWGVADSECSPARLQRQLDRVEPGIYVINAGVPSYTSPQVLLYLEQLLPRYRPAAVVVNILWNDAIYSCLGNWMPEYLVHQQASPWQRFLLAHSAVYRALVIHDPAALPAKQVRNPRALHYYTMNLEAIVLECRRARAPVIFVRPSFDRDQIRDEGIRIASGIVPKSTFVALLNDFLDALDAVVTRTDVPCVRDSLPGVDAGAGNCFIDPFHLNAAGNERLAQDEARLLIRTALPPSK